MGYYLDRDIVKRYNYGLQNRHCGFDSYCPCFINIILASVAKWLTHRFVAPTLVGSIPITRPFLLGYSQAVRQQTLTLSFVGSNPAIPVFYLWRYSQVVRHGSAKA